MSLIVSGASMWTALSDDTVENFSQMCKGVTALSELKFLESNVFSTKKAFEIKGEVEVSKPAMLRSTRWLSKVILDAANEAELDLSEIKVAVIIGTGLREQSSLEKWAADGEDFAIEDWHYKKMVQATLGHNVPVYCLVNACSASLCGLTLAADMLSLGQFDAVILAGSDSIAESMFGLLERATPKSPEKLTPFDQNRPGVIMGEGAAAIVLETESLAKSDKALAKLLSTTLNCDANSETAPDKDGIKNCIQNAFDLAGCSAADIDLVMAHGTGTLLNDDTESKALFELFGSHASTTHLSAIKAMTGHTAGASGLIGLITAIYAMKEKTVPPTPGLISPIEDVSHFILSTEKITDIDIKCVQVNAFGFGGVNAVAILQNLNGESC